MNGNGNEFHSTGNPDVDAALKRLHLKYKELEDAMIVQAHLEKRQSEAIERHALFIDKHDRVMSEIEDKLNALTMWLMRREGLPEAGAN